MDFARSNQYSTISSPAQPIQFYFSICLKRLSPQSSSSAPAGSGFKLTSLCEGGERKRERERERERGGPEQERISQLRELTV